MDVSQETVERIQRFSEKRQEAEETYNKQPLNISNVQAYNSKLDDTLRQLQDRVRRHEKDLRKLREVNAVDLDKMESDPWSRVSQVRRAKKAYDSLLKSGTELPKPGSPLPSLLALEETIRLVKESRTSISMTAEKLSLDRQRLKVEETNLRDAQSIRDGLQRRIQNIRRDASQKQEKSPSQLAREAISTQETKKDNIDKATDDLRASLHKFVDESLAPMVAAENLGGPTVGDVFNISDTTLNAGYTSHGKPKKPKSLDTEGPDTNQRRIDELLNRQSGQNGSHPSNKREAAATEIHELLDALLDAGSSYIDLPRESAASRFLVRAKVAQFHPRDARRLRLIDFARALDD
ncbi:hypothetical protein P168DRAFT_298076 [Aspergillus campestris IBT 28561]|uniref:Uncharacterized protein n=1 Tax=Aspergillus campestris (strain IBT 28561) TaxID=1392248 RepID=A0A2I1D078_ASPC2|nr:uncharacterized protein P168DRAFT_298076 [Aspergillus campestris IBT 28561]PKY03274.1 hypothetical protein P168DRAFT_298076 [Aspergillus campestris IBT 28561]